MAAAWSPGSARTGCTSTSATCSPDELATDQLLGVQAADGDAGELLDEFAWTADAEPERNRWSYARDYGRVRLIVLDSRCARVLTPATAR